MRARTSDGHLVQQQRETRQPSGGSRYELNSGKVRADRQNGVVLKQDSAVEKPRESRPMSQFVEIVEEERAAEHVGDLKPETEDDRDPDALVPRSGRTGEAPGARALINVSPARKSGTTGDWGPVRPKASPSPTINRPAPGLR